MIDRNKYESLADALASVDDLEAVKRALIQEATLRQIMAETGESREVILEMIGAMESMDQEAVLDLTEGEPTTLADGLDRYVTTLEQAAAEDETLKAGDVYGALTALLAYPWPDGPAPANTVLKVDGSDDERLVIISVGGVEVATANYDEHGWSGMELAQRTAESVHRAVLAAVRAKS